MSVASRNPFALLEDDTSSRPSTPAPAQAAASPAAAAPAPTRGTQKSRGGPAARGGRYYQRGGKPSAPKENQNGDVAAEDGAEPRKRFDGEGRGRGRGGRGRGGERGRGGRRPFDKHSATGKTDSDKKVHQGWGGDEGAAELKVETAAETDAQAEASAPAADGWGEPAATDVWSAPAEGAEGAAPAEGEKAESRPRREEEEDNTLTLEEYQKKQTEEKALDIVPKLEARKANEGDDSIWKDAVVVTKKTQEEDAYFVGKTKSNAPKAKAQKVEKVFLEIDARFERPQRGGRGGRGGDRPPRGTRGRGGRGRGANGASSGPALNVDDQTAFPSLS
ncbi:hypothetical protein PHLGIDRAFT_27613 [Phlebiopsis gigantea 11061_1 CR5-6]|uniref:Hyaluronan/mRNA-binding protein domain-containing protein n=1 Tax=Phlebiopsis gigantea (strain 11061_1 CR5-6) TaxID=745531 RepID=A0A0C3PVR2_PHLG1|nr:hypothetical protein PHLGIDRAFT_27613 [Phlebiopsis gigantea 11061_1 CR5-6]